jgi:hypothetical protein
MVDNNVMGGRASEKPRTRFGLSFILIDHLRRLLPAIVLAHGSTIAILIVVPGIVTTTTNGCSRGRGSYPQAVAPIAAGVAKGVPTHRIEVLCQWPKLAGDWLRLTAGVGDVVLWAEGRENMPNILGRADLFCRTRPTGFTTCHLFVATRISGPGR